MKKWLEINNPSYYKLLIVSISRVFSSSLFYTKYLKSVCMALVIVYRYRHIAIDMVT